MFIYARWVAYALVVQLFLLSLSFPVLVSWAIGFSPLVFVGNIIFTPFLTIFLALSAFVFLFEGFGVSAYYLCYSLDFVAHLWIYLMRLAPDVALIACPDAPLWVLLIMPLGSSVLVWTYGFKDIFKILAALVVWVSVIFFGIKWGFTPVSKNVPVPCGSKMVHIIKNNDLITLYDDQLALSSRSCTQSWIDYTLSQALIRHLGATTIDSITVKKITPGVKKCSQQIAQKYRCKKICDTQGNVLQI